MLSTAYLLLHEVTDTCSFLDAPFFTAKVFFGGITNFFQLYNLQTHAMFKLWGGCMMNSEMLQPNTNLLIGGEHITYNPIVVVNFY